MATGEVTALTLPHPPDKLTPHRSRIFQRTSHRIDRDDHRKEQAGPAKVIRIVSREWSSTCMGQLSPEWLAPLAKECVMNAHRTPEEIQAQLEARYAEMEAEAERMAKAALTACSACRWGDRGWCKNPLVIGIKQNASLNADYNGKTQHAVLCGREKALWEPKLTRWQKFIEWLHRVIDRLEAPLALTGGKG